MIPHIQSSVHLVNFTKFLENPTTSNNPPWTLVQTTILLYLMDYFDNLISSHSAYNLPLVLSSNQSASLVLTFFKDKLEDVSSILKSFYCFFFFFLRESTPSRPNPYFLKPSPFFHSNHTGLQDIPQTLEACS